MTSRARWLALAAVSGAFLGVLRGQQLLALLSISVLLWLLVEWLVFSVRVARLIPRLQIRRLVNGREQTRGILWAGRDVTVRLILQQGSENRVSAPWQPPLLTLKEMLPENLQVTGTPHQQTLTEHWRSAELTFTARIPAAGEVVLTGVRITLADVQAFFRCERFIPLAAVFQVLPIRVDAGDARPGIKRLNALPQHGIHRLQRSGMGCELLELREYVAGDPPKSIAWKVSARRDRLMTRQYESEVPVRVQLLIDGSIATRIGGYGLRLLDQMTTVAASICHAATRVGDPVGALLIDERGLRRVPAGTGDRGCLQLLRALADFSVNPAPPPARLNSAMLASALSLVNERYPEFLDYRVNQIPFTVFPVLPWNRRRFHERYTLASVMAHVYQVSEHRHAQMIHDDAVMAAFLQDFLNQFGQAWMEPVVENRRRSEQDSVPRMQQLSAAIVQSVARARDHEVMVILADLLESVAGLSHLLPAVRLAIARHHRVAIVCPSPTFLHPSPDTVEPRSLQTEDLLLAAEQIRIRELAIRLRRELARSGAAVAVSGQQQALPMVLAQIELARTGRTVSAGARRSAGAAR